MTVVLGLFLWLFLWYYDIMPGNPPPSALEHAFSWVCLAGLWPFVVTALILGHDPEGPLSLLPLWIVTGLFWGFIAESFFVLKARISARLAAKA